MTGFDFSNHNRNLALHAQGVPLPNATSTGTTIVGCIFEGGVVIAADTRATAGPIVADKVHDADYHLSAGIMLNLSSELREAPLYRATDMVCRRRYSSRHRIHHCPHLLQPRTTFPIYRPQTTCRHSHDDAEAAPLPIPRPYRSVPGGRRG